MDDYVKDERAVVVGIAGYWAEGLKHLEAAGIATLRDYHAMNASRHGVDASAGTGSAAAKKHTAAVTS